MGLPPRDEIDVRDIALVNGGRQTFCIREHTKSAICRRSSSCESPINGNVQSDALKMYSLPSLPTTTDTPHTSIPANSSDTWN